MKHKKLWQERLFGVGKWLLLGILVLCAGCFYSCGGRGEEPELVLAAAEAGFSGEGQETAAENPEESQSDKGREPETENGQRAEPDAPLQSGGEKTVDAAELEAAEPETTQPETKPICYVYVCGQVHQPGVYVLEEGQRIFEAVEMAGGFTAEAAEGYLNLAALVTDGMKIQVPDKSQAADPKWQMAAGLSGGSSMSGSAAGTGSMGAGSGGTQAAAKVNLNTATKEELMNLTGVGASRAEDIIRYREKNGGFARIEDIMKVSGIKEASFEKIKDQITV